MRGRVNKFSNEELVCDVAGCAAVVVAVVVAGVVVGGGNGMGRLGC